MIGANFPEVKDKILRQVVTNFSLKKLAINLALAEGERTDDGLTNGASDLIQFGRHAKPSKGGIESIAHPS